MKSVEYLQLVDERKACRACSGLANPAEWATFDSPEIGPWSRLHGDLDAQIMVVGQDWGDVGYYQDFKGLDDFANPTMRTLEKLLRSINLDVSLQAYGEGPRGLFLTNAVLCLKKGVGGLQAPVEEAWFSNCGQRFLKRQIEIVRPRVVVSLGQRAYEAIVAAFGLKRLRFRDAVAGGAVQLVPGVRLVPVYHCGNRILNTHRKLPAQMEDWRRVRAAMGGVKA